MNISKDYLLNPLTIFMAVWVFVFGLDGVFKYLDPEYFYPFSEEMILFFVMVFSVWALGFFCVSLVPKGVFLLRNPFAFPFLNSYRRLSFCYVLLMLFSLVLISYERFLQVGPLFYLPDGVMQYRIILTVEGGKALFPWVSLFNFFFFFYPAFVVSWFFSSEKISFRTVAAGMAAFLLFVYLSTARSAVFFPVLIAFFTALHYRFRVRYFLYLLFILFLFFGVIGALVGKAGFDKIFFYILSPIHAFDLIYTGSSDYQPGFLSFRIFHSLLQSLGIIEASLVSLENIYTPKPTNVFTVFGVYYLDYGLSGMLLFMFFFSLFSSCFYYFARIRRSPRSVIASSLSYVLICLGVFYDYYTSTFFVFFALIYTLIFFPGKR